MLDLVRGNPRRLVMLMLATIAAYACMALEAWVILRASGTPITAVGALTVETFSRVASFASAFIPANLGALEASSLAAIGGVGVTAAAPRSHSRAGFADCSGPASAWRSTRAAPGANRWQGPAMRGAIPHATSRMRRMIDTPRPVLLYVPWDPAVRVSPNVRIASLPAGERVVRSALKAGYGRVIVWTPNLSLAPVRQPRAPARRRGRRGDRRRVAHRNRRARSCLRPSQSIGAGTVVSPALLADAARLPVDADAAVDVPAGADWPISGVIRVRPADAMNPAALSTLLSPRWAHASRPSGDDVSNGRAHLAIRMIEPADIEPAERTIRRSIFKDTDEHVARFNRKISLPISIVLMRTPLTANQLSILLVAVGFYSGWLFSIGHYWTGVLAAFLSLAASILDGCDGEIARLKYQESRSAAGSRPSAITRTTSPSSSA